MDESYRRTNDASGQEVADSTAGATAARDLEREWIVGGKCTWCWRQNDREGCDWAMCGCSCHDESPFDYWDQEED